MRKSIVFAATALLAVASSEAGANQNLPPGAVRLQRVEVMDPSGFEKPMAAFTMLIPAGWQTQGGVVWTVAGGCYSGFNMNWTATSPDGQSGAAQFPGVGWIFSSLSPPQGHPGCINVRFNSVREYLEYLAQTGRPGSRVLDYRERPDLMKGLEQNNSVTPMLGGGEMRSWVEAGEILIGYPLNGVDTREIVSSVVFFSRTLMPDGIGGGGMFEQFTGTAMPGFAYRTPEGQLDFKVAEAIRTSNKSVREWQARVDRGNAEVAKVSPVDPTLIGREGAKRTEIIAQTGDAIREMQRQSTQTYNNISSGIQTTNVEAIRGVETYNDPQSTTGTVELSNQYNHAWRMQDGTYVLTDDPSFNPYLSLGQDGAKLEQTQ